MPFSFHRWSTVVGIFSCSLTVPTFVAVTAQLRDNCDETSLLQVGSSLTSRGAEVDEIGRTKRVIREDLMAKLHLSMPDHPSVEEVAPPPTVNRPPPPKTHPVGLMQTGMASSIQSQVGSQSAVASQSAAALMAENRRLKEQLLDLQEFIDPSALIMDGFMSFVQGKFNGPGCRHEAGRIYSHDAVIDMRGPKDTRFFKKYGPGLDGVCEFFANAQKYYSMEGLQLELHAKGQRMGHVWNFKPITMADEHGRVNKSSGRLTQYNDITLNDENTRIARYEAFFDKPHLLDELGMDKTESKTTPQMQTAENIFNDFASGKYFGKGCKDAANATVTKDITVDMTGWSETDMLKKFGPGLDGFCEYTAKSYASALYNLNITRYQRGDDAVEVMNYYPGFAGLAVKADDPVNQFNVYRFNGDGSKVRTLDILFDKPAVFDELNAKPEAQAALESLKNRVYVYQMTRNAVAQSPQPRPESAPPQIY